ncbi:MAG: formyltetrahydrofolate deformylase [Candidatus Caenarcaniphilales bacterium]|nr:formyltetrahydrofolate deformylase [Candidatus Caenarcaniphilales bacterium]
MTTNIQPNKAILLLSCPDKQGIVARISHFIFERKGNIINLDQHVDVEDKKFFMRVEWSLENFTIPSKDLHEAFAPMAKEFKADWNIDLVGDQKPKVAIMVSKYSHCLLDLLWRIETEEINCQVPVIISNHPDLDHIAKAHNIDYNVFPITKETKQEQEEKEIALLKELNVELIVLARYMQILSDSFVKEFPNKIINIHHSFLPAFIGSNPYKQAQDRGVKIIGATSHYATTDLDEGPIIQQDITCISHRDSLNDLVCKGRDLERIVLARAVKLHLEHRILVHGHKTIIFEK